MFEMLSNLSDAGGGPIATAIDFIIVFYLVYLTLLLIRGTRTASMALGLLVLVIVYLLSRFFGLSTTYMLLDQFMEVAVIFALIIFQDDIRRGLARMGRFAKFSTVRESQVLEDVIRAAGNLASKRIGAIIVFERNASLDEFIETRVHLDAAVTKELLYAIFIPRMENPLHDGAVILKGFRIREAGALLPASENPHLDKTMGTRHRAALGITEATDAVSIVVSEERGTISLCAAGRIHKDLDMKSLRKTLVEQFQKEKTKISSAEKRRGQGRQEDNASEPLKETGGSEPENPTEPSLERAEKHQPTKVE